MKYCIGCVHMIFQSEDLSMGSTMTGPYGDDFELRCGKNHWDVDKRRTTQEQFCAYMESAETCKDFSERAV